mgnify:CR=1 FL=1
MIVGGHIYGVPMDQMLIDDIENSQWIVRCRPGDGARFLFLPKDQSDFEFYPAITGKANNAGSTPY